MPFCRDYFWTVNLSISNCVRPNTFQDAVFPLFCWHILQFLLHRRSLSYWASTTPSWRSRVGFRPWCTGWATCRHTWKWRLQWERERQRDSPQYSGLDFTELVPRVVSSLVAVNEKAETKSMTQTTQWLHKYFYNKIELFLIKGGLILRASVWMQNKLY